MGLGNRRVFEIERAWQDVRVNGTVFCMTQFPASPEQPDRLVKKLSQIQFTLVEKDAIRKIGKHALVVERSAE